MQANLIELSMYQISQLFLIPTLVLIAALFLYAFWVLGEFALLAFYRRRVSVPSTFCASRRRLSCGVRRRAM